MKSVTISGTGLAVSRLVFGTASLIKAGSARNRIAVLEEAVAQSFTHFDTAPYYGFGLGERDLAPVLRAHPAITFTTKVGIYSPGGENQPALAVLLRKVAGKAIKAIVRPEIDFALDRARTTMEASLRRTGRDCIDLYLMHEPEVGLVRLDEWRRWLEDCVTAGKIRHYGAALTAERLEDFLTLGDNPGQVLQVSDSIADHEADVLARAGRPMQLTFGYISAALRAANPPPVAQVIARALARNNQGAVLVSTTKLHRVAQLADMARAAGA